MSLDKLDHVAIEVSAIDPVIDKMLSTGGLKLLRRGVANSTGARIAMLGDRTGMKIELIENPEAREARFLHLAFRSAGVDAAAKQLVGLGWAVDRGPLDIPAAKARSAFFTDGAGFEFQVVTYQPDSPDIQEW